MAFFNSMIILHIFVPQNTNRSNDKERIPVMTDREIIDDIKKYLVSSKCFTYLMRNSITKRFGL